MLTKPDMPVPLPPPLKPGGTIGIVSPARRPKPEWLVAGKALLENRGYKVVVHAQNYLKDGQLAGSDAARAEAIRDVFADSTIDAVMCARGGTGTLRILDRLDYKLIHSNPKPFVGFSDITLLLQAISKKCGFAAFHGPVFWNFANPYDPRTIDDLFAVIGEGPPKRKLHYSGVTGLETGRAEGRLVGGNISLLQNLIGTPYDWSAKDAILVLEDVDEVIYKIDRTLTHFRLAGKFEGVRAVVVGEMLEIADGESGFLREGEQPYGRDLRQIFAENLPRGIPLCMNFPCGHGKYITTLPIGADVVLKLDSQSAELSFAGP
jgi:muramoyltetrapeptide carboxypeptidase